MNGNTSTDKYRCSRTRTWRRGSYFSSLERAASSSAVDPSGDVMVGSGLLALMFLGWVVLFVWYPSAQGRLG